MITITKQIELSGNELAEQFWEMSCTDQAEFFNNNKFMDVENSYRARIQLDRLIEYLNEDGVKFIKMIFDSVKELEEINENTI